MFLLDSASIFFRGVNQLLFSRLVVKIQHSHKIPSESEKKKLLNLMRIVLKVARINLFINKMNWVPKQTLCLSFGSVWLLIFIAFFLSSQHLPFCWLLRWNLPVSGKSQEQCMLSIPTYGPLFAFIHHEKYAYKFSKAIVTKNGVYACDASLWVK